MAREGEAKEEEEEEEVDEATDQKGRAGLCE